MNLRLQMVASDGESMSSFSPTDYSTWINGKLREKLQPEYYRRIDRVRIDRIFWGRSGDAELASLEVSVWRNVSKFTLQADVLLPMARAGRRRGRKGRFDLPKPVLARLILFLQ